MKNAMHKVLDEAGILPQSYYAMSDSKYLDTKVDEALKWLFSFWYSEHEPVMDDKEE